MSEVYFHSNVNGVDSELEQKVAKALEMIGLKCEGYTKKNCPVDTGNLRNSITHRVGTHEVTIGSVVEYAPYVEMGTRYTRAQPYLKPAIEQHLSEYKRILQQALK